MTTAISRSTPVIIIGAGRSGTNMLRDIVATLPFYGTWPCDEINYIWRHGNAHQPTDEFLPQMATEGVQKYIRAAFERIATQQRINTVVEKTCANSLRVRFVERIFPDARYIYIVRDGRDVVASAIKRWTAPLDLTYILRKSRYVPYSDIPYYAIRYLRNHIHRLKSGEKQLAFWGPRFAGMDEAQRLKPLYEVCALQWQRCIERSEEDFAGISPERVHRLTYEAFVQDPVAGIKDIAAFLGASLNTAEVRKIALTVSAGNVGKWRHDLPGDEQARIESLLESTLRNYEYV